MNVLIQTNNFEINLDHYYCRVNETWNYQAIIRCFSQVVIQPQKFKFYGKNIIELFFINYQRYGWSKLVPKFLNNLAFEFDLLIFKLRFNKEKIDNKFIFRDHFI